MPRATGTTSQLARYEEAWEAINRLVRSGGSWSGSERNCFWRGLPGGQFLKLSAASGLDVDDDGRAVSVFDFDRDGDPDLLVKNRTGPQLRLWRNRSDSEAHRVTLRLEGLRSNVQGIGSRVRLRFGDRVRVKELRAGTGFLSQDAALLFFGLGDAETIDELTVRWPDGGVQTFRDVPADRALTIREGRPELRSQPLARPPADRATKPAALSRGKGPAPRRPWLLDPVALRTLDLVDATGRARRLDEFRGRPLVVALWSPDCARCVLELTEWSRERRGSAAGPGQKNQAPSLVVLTAGGDAESARVQQALRGAGQRFGVEMLHLDEASLLTLAIEIEDLVRWPRQLTLPMSLLLDAEGRIVRLYEGAVDWSQLASDAALLPLDAAGRRRRALPFPGRYWSSSTVRSEFQLGVSYLEAGLPGAAAGAFLRTLEKRPDDVEALYNIALIQLESGDLRAARDLFLRVTRLQSDFLDAWVNLGVAEARLGRLDEAQKHFEHVLTLRPGHVEARLDLGNVWLERGDSKRAVEAFLKASELAPESTAPLKRLAAAYRRARDAEAARSVLEKATRIDPEDGESWSSLAVLHAEGGRLEEAHRLAERAIEVAPEYVSAWVNDGLILQLLGRTAEAEARYRTALEKDAENLDALLNLSKMYLRSGREVAARKTLERALEVSPDHPLVRQLLQLIE